MKKPKKCISVEEARKEQDEWVKTRGKDIREAEGYEDTREFWYSVDELQEYLDYVKEKSKEQGVLSPTKEAAGDTATAKEDSDPNNYEIEPMNIIQSGDPPTNY